MHFSNPQKQFWALINITSLREQKESLREYILVYRFLGLLVKFNTLKLLSWFTNKKLLLCGTFFPKVSGLGISYDQLKFNQVKLLSWFPNKKQLLCGTFFNLK